MVDEDNYDLIFKLVLICDTGVGKTNILSRYINNEFSLATQSTVGVEFGSKIIKKNDKLIKLQIWDTAGQERYKSITSAYYKGSKGALVVYDISRKGTFENVDKWIEELKANGSEDVLIMLVGNKSDLEDKREVKTEDVIKKAEQFKVAFCETSALDGKNIDHAFDNLINEIAKKVERDKVNEAKNMQDSKGITLDTAEEKRNETDKNKKNNQNCC
jgi:small GTP-binding protein